MMRNDDTEGRHTEDVDNIFTYLATQTATFHCKQSPGDLNPANKETHVSRDEKVRVIIPCTETDIQLFPHPPYNKIMGLM